MAKIQRLKISTDEKMSILRGQPGHMPAAPAAAESVAPASVPEPVPILTAAPPVPAPPVEVAAPVTSPVAVTKQTTSVALAPKKGRGRPPKVQVTATVEGISAGLQPSLIRLEGETQRAALAYIYEELMHHSRRVYLKELVNEAVNYYLQHGPPVKGK